MSFAGATTEVATQLATCCFEVGMKSPLHEQFQTISLKIIVPYHGSYLSSA